MRQQPYLRVFSVRPTTSNARDDVLVRAIVVCKLERHVVSNVMLYNQNCIFIPKRFPTNLPRRTSAILAVCLSTAMYRTGLHNTKPLRSLCKFWVYSVKVCVDESLGSAVRAVGHRRRMRIRASRRAGDNYVEHGGYFWHTLDGADTEGPNDGAPNGAVRRLVMAALTTTCLCRWAGS